MDLKPEYKVFSFKAEGDGMEDGKIEGYASTFGNMDLGYDIVQEGAFTKTLKESKGIFPILADHSPEKLIGYNQEAKEDKKGLFVKGQLNLEVALARERHALAKQAIALGAPFGLSIGYYTIKSEPDKEKPVVRLLKELKLIEYSIVTFPMNTRAMLTAAKSMNMIDKAKFLIAELERQGISRADLELALQQEAVKADMDPLQLKQSLDNLIGKFTS